MAKANLKGNWACFITKENSPLSVNILILGTATIEPMWDPVMILASVTFEASLVMIKRVPLHSPKFLLMFRRRLTGAPIFSFKEWFGTPEVVKEL